MSKSIKRGAKPGENRFKTKQESVILNTTLEIKSVLAMLRKRGVKFRNITNLASYIAALITEKRGEKKKKMATSTLLRQSHYRELLDSYMLSIELISEDKKVNTLIESLDRQYLERLKDENKRLSKFIENNLAQKSEEILSPNQAIISNNEQDHLCRAISLLLEASNGQFQIDKENNQIVNGWARSQKNRVVVEKKHAQFYINWQSSFPKLG